MMNYAEKFGFTPIQVKAIRDKEIREGYYDGRFERDYVEEKPAKPDPLPESNAGEAKNEQEPEKQSRPKKPHKGGK